MEPPTTPPGSEPLPIQAGDAPGAAERAHHRVPLWLIAVTLALFGCLVVMQRPHVPSAKEVERLGNGEIVDRPAVSEYVLLGKLLIALRSIGGADSGLVQSQIIEATDDLAMQSGAAQDRFRGAILAGEAGGFDAISRRFDALLPDLSPDSPLREDIATVTDAYRNASPDRDLRDSPAADDLFERHGWVGELALDQAAAAASADAQGKPGGVVPIDDFRTRAANDGLILVFVLAGFGCVALIAFLAGVVLHIIGWVRFATGRLRRYEPRPGIAPARLVEAARAQPAVPARVWVETFALFLLGFLLVLRVIPGIVLAFVPGTHISAWCLLLGEWMLTPLVLWPIFRAASWDRVRFEVGWHRGRGVVREMVAGLVAYLAMLPVLIAVAVVSLVVNKLLGGHSAPARDNPVLERATGGAVELFLLATLVSIWAPIVEESLFRGVVFRFFRARWGLLAGAAGSALLFASMHGYALQGLIVVGTMGFSFALMREWRGSLIPSMTAHCIHNSVAFVLIVTIASLAKG